MSEPNYKAFACELMNEATKWEGSCEGVEGLDLQDLAAKHKLLLVTKQTTPCGYACPCADYHGEGEQVDCYRHNWDKAETLEVPE